MTETQREVVKRLARAAALAALPRGLRGAVCRPGGDGRGCGHLWEVVDVGTIPPPPMVTSKWPTVGSTDSVWAV